MTRDFWYPPPIESIFDKKNRGFVATSKGEIIGLIYYVPDEKYDYPSIAIAIADAYQREGIGTELLNRLYNLAKSEGYKGLYVGVLQYNCVAIHFYRKNGFIVIGEKIARNGDKAWEMRKE